MGNTSGNLKHNHMDRWCYLMEILELILGIYRYPKYYIIGGRKYYA